MVSGENNDNYVKILFADPDLISPILLPEPLMTPTSAQTLHLHPY